MNVQYFYKFFLLLWKRLLCLHFFGISIDFKAGRKKKTHNTRDLKDLLLV